MQVMKSYVFLDDDIEKVLITANENMREIVLKELTEGALLISKEDVVAFAKEFGLVVYEKESCL